MTLILKNKFILAAFLTGVASVTVFFLFFSGPKETTITLTPTGYSPAEVTINVGDTVTFKTEKGEPHWPASSQHPSHLDYPDFDSKKPVPPKETWSFTFTEPGTYAFHDHIRSSNTGVVYVGEGAGDDEASATSFQNCLDIPEVSEKVSCWNAHVVDVLNTKGVSSAFDEFKRIYKADEIFVSHGCHGTAHNIGEAAYDLYKVNADIELTADTAVCGYGFYHGFLERLLHDNPDLENAREFCNSLTAKLGDDLDSIRVNCFHGIGHGMVEEEPLPEYYWGDKDSLLIPALKVCASISDEPLEVRECADGAFNGLSRFMVYDKYGFTYNRKDPLTWCNEFKDTEVFYASCLFENSQHFVDLVLENDINKLWPLIKDLEPGYQDMIVSTALTGFIQSDVIRKDNSEYFERCTVLPEQHLRDSCLHGVVNGFFQHGEPGNEAEKAIEFCDADVASDTERETCKNILASYLR